MTQERRTFKGYQWVRAESHGEPRLSDGIARAARRREAEERRRHRGSVFRGPAGLRETWLALAERHGVADADRILGERLGMKPQSVAYRRRTDMWYGIRWEAAVAGLVPEARTR